MTDHRSEPGARELLSRYATQAVETAARELGVEPLDLARSLGDAQIARLLHLLNAAFRHVEHPGLRHRIEDLLMAVSDGRMPAQAAESELDWALKVVRRRSERERGTGGDEEATGRDEEAPDGDD
jgi:hypothetical protein